MNIPGSIQVSIKKELDFFCKNLPGQPRELYEPMRYMLSLGGKNIRPLLLLLTCKMFGGKLKDAIPAAIAMELFHNFTLIHDDVADNSPLRRNSPTVHAKWGLNIALLSGDALLIESYRQLNKISLKYLPAVFRLFNDAALKVCEGQQFDMNYEREGNVSIPDYFNMIRLKTAALFAASMEMGALLAGASANDCSKMKTAGENLGVLFQLKDDALDVFGKPRKTGKQSGGDIIQGKKTFLLLKAMELAKGKMKSELRLLIGDKKTPPRQKVEKVKKIYENLGVEKDVNTQMQLYFTNVKDLLAYITSPEKTILLELAGELIQREV